jgi:hypothetical protein
MTGSEVCAELERIEAEIKPWLDDLPGFSFFWSGKGDVVYGGVKTNPWDLFRALTGSYRNGEVASFPRHFRDLFLAYIGRFLSYRETVQFLSHAEALRFLAQARAALAADALDEMGRQPW